MYLYLSRLLLNPRSHQVRSELARPYEMHRTLMRAFPHNLPNGEERVLYRIETEPRTEVPMLLVQSHLRPAWDRLPASYLAASDDDSAVKTFAPRLHVGQVLAFRLAANPTKRVSEQSRIATAAGLQPVATPMVGKRIGLYTEAEQLNWLARKGEQNGFHPLTVTIGQQDQIKMTRPAKSIDQQPHLITLHGVRFDGLLQVDDPAQLLTSVAQGIGSGKAFGFGLLSLAPAR